MPTPRAPATRARLVRGNPRMFRADQGRQDQDEVMHGGGDGVLHPGVQGGAGEDAGA